MVFAHLSQPAAIVDARQRIQLWNPAAATLSGWTAERVRGLGLGSVLGITPRSFAPIARQMANGATLPELLLEGRRMGGAAMRIRFAAHPLEVRDGGTLYLCMFPPMPDAQDLHGNPQTPVAPGIPEVLRTFMGTLPVAVALVAHDGIVLFANDEAAEKLGARAGARCCDVFCGAHLGECPVRKSARSFSEERWEKVGQGAGANGRRELVARPFQAGAGQSPLVLVCASSNGGDTASAELRKFFRAVDQNTAGVLLTDEAGRIEYANPRCSEIVGLSPIEMIGRPVFTDATDSSESPPLLPLSRPSDSGADSQDEISHLRPDGKTVRIRYAVSNLRDDSYAITHWVIVLDDITERSLLEQGERALRDQLAHTSRLASVGEMASVIAHEINQPLSNIANFSAGCIRRLESGQWQVEPIVDALQIIANEVGRAGDIVRNVRGFVRRGDAIQGSIDINQVVRNVMPLISALSRRQHVTIELDLDRAEPRANGDRTQIEQILINLIRNAVEAMADTDDDRRITLRTRIDSQRRVWVAVEDAGCGMDDVTFSRLGEPFLTTKPDGLGLGLSITRTLLEAHGSRLEALYNPGRGMTFFFALSPPPA